MYLLTFTNRNLPKKNKSISLITKISQGIDKMLISKKKYNKKDIWKKLLRKIFGRQVYVQQKKQKIKKEI